MLGDITSPEFRVRLRDMGAKIRPETLVSLIRAARDLPDVTLYWDLGDILVGRERRTGRIGGFCNSQILYWARQWGFADNPEDLDDFRQEAYRFIWRAVAEPDYYRKGLTSNFPETVEWILRSAKDEIVKNRIKTSMEGDLDDSRFADSETLARVDHALSVLPESIDIRAAVDGLPPAERRVVELRYLHGLPPGADRPGPDDEQRTVASEMGISAGMVRRHLRNARRRLASNPTVAEVLARLGYRHDEPEGEEER